MQGYSKKLEGTAQAIDTKSSLPSGDMVIMREDATICFLGRYKEMRKVGGEKVAPVEVEALLLPHPAEPQGKCVRLRMAMRG
jgi:acyl-CoA synthetase (AMP-forming)/AMP-acid ligase II